MATKTHRNMSPHAMTEKLMGAKPLYFPAIGGVFRLQDQFHKAEQAVRGLLHAASDIDHKSMEHARWQSGPTKGEYERFCEHVWGSEEPEGFSPCAVLFRQAIHLARVYHLIGDIGDGKA